ncbi:hypothetical protein I547_4409 [Mycobacterium kansasii 824]|nr:hypothetical protein I547_4409 [Mycobacterium kansasii 824]
MSTTQPPLASGFRPGWDAAAHAAGPKPLGAGQIRPLPEEPGNP